VGDQITFTASGWYQVGGRATVTDSGIITSIGSGTALIGMAISGVTSGGIFTMLNRGYYTLTASA